MATRGSARELDAGTQAILAELRDLRREMRAERREMRAERQQADADRREWRRSQAESRAEWRKSQAESRAEWRKSQEEWRKSEAEWRQQRRQADERFDRLLDDFWTDARRREAATQAAFRDVRAVGLTIVKTLNRHTRILEEIVRTLGQHTGLLQGIDRKLGARTDGGPTDGHARGA
jgi:hypothetical protein